MELHIDQKDKDMYIRVYDEHNCFVLSITSRSGSYPGLFIQNYNGEIMKIIGVDII